jgi:hypothetical protein
MLFSLGRSVRLKLFRRILVAPISMTLVACARLLQLFQQLAAAPLGKNPDLRHSAFRATIPRLRNIDLQRPRLIADILTSSTFHASAIDDRTLVVLPWWTLKHGNSPARCNCPTCPLFGNLPGNRPIWIAR